jgi:hypothetical protein
MTIRNLEIKQVTIAGIAGFQIQGIYRDCSDSFWETIAHAAVFKDRRRAERFLEKVKAVPSWEYGRLKTGGYPEQQWGAPVGAYTSVSNLIQTNVAAYSPL